MCKPTARTVFEYWSYLMKPNSEHFPTGCSVEVATQPVGLFLTIKRNESKGFDLIGRSRINIDSVLAESILNQLAKEHGEIGPDFGSVTVIINHRLLPEATGRKVVIEAFDNDTPLDLSYYNVTILSTEGSNWPAVVWEHCHTPEELQSRYEMEHKNGSIGLLLRVTDSNGKIRWYRRPAEFRLVVKVVGVTNYRVFLQYRDNETGVTYNGYFNRGEKDVIERLIEDYPDLKGKFMEITTKSMNQTAAKEFQLYAIRYERLVEALPPPAEQFKLV